MHLVDPNHHIEFAGSKTKNGVTKSVYTADIEGTNAVMIW